MAIVTGFDGHTAQLTCDALNQETGEVHRGRIAATQGRCGAESAAFGASGSRSQWRPARAGCWCAKALRAAGAGAHLAETAETRARRGTKRRAKTDRADARWLRTLLAEGRLPEAWIAPAQVRESRTRSRPRRTPVDERTAWLVRIQATPFHHATGWMTGASPTPPRPQPATGRPTSRGPNPP
jgi:transposase